MELLCVESSTSDSKGALLVIKGCRYTLTRVVESDFIPRGRNNNICYELLETGMWLHHSSLFVIAPPVRDSEIEESKLLLAEK